MADFIVYTYDNIEAVAAVLNGISSIMGGSASGYRDMIKTLGILGFMVSIISFLVNPTRIAAFSWFGGFMFVYFLLFLPVTRVNIVDIVRTGEARTVDNVPAALAVTASLSSTVGYKLTRVFETVMQVLPVSLGDGSKTFSTCESSPQAECMFRFSQGGMMFGNKLMGRIERASREAAASLDPKVDKDIYEFLSQCTAFDLSQGLISYDGVSKATDLWEAIRNTSAARYVTENNVFKDCPSAYQSLTGRRNALGERLEALVARSVYPSLRDDDAKSRFNNAYKDYAAATGVGNAGWEVKQFLLQNTLINQAKRGLGRMGMEAGSTSAVMLGQAEAATFAGTNASFITQSRLAEEALPLIRNGIEAILYGIFPIVVLVMLAQSGPALVTAIKGFVFAFIWIQLWPPLYALVNYIGQIRSMQSLKIIVDSMKDGSASEVGLAFVNYNNIYNGQISDQAVMGYLIIAVPVIASSIIYGMNSAMGSIGGAAFIGTAGRAGEAAGSGNVNIGNVSMGQQTLGPSRTDADVFTHTSQGGQFKYGLSEDGMQSLSSTFNNTSGPFRISVSDQNVASMKQSYTQQLSALTSERDQLSNSVDSAFSKMLQTDTGFKKFAEDRHAHAHKESAGAGTGYERAAGLSSAGNITDTSGHLTTRNDGVSHNEDLGAKAFGVGAGKNLQAAAGSGETAGSGVTAGQGGQVGASAAEKAEYMDAYQKEHGFTRGSGNEVSASNGKNLTFGEAAQELKSLENQVAHAQQLSASLETMSSSKINVEQDLLHEATQGLNAEKGATYVQNLSDTEKREQITAYAVDNILSKKIGFSKEEAAQLVDGGRTSYVAGNVNNNHGITREDAGMTQEALVNHMNNGSSLTGRQYQAPEALDKQAKHGFFDRGVTPNMAPKDTVGGAVETQLAKLHEETGATLKVTRDAAQQRIEGASGQVDRAQDALSAHKKELEDKSAVSTVAGGAFGAVKEVGAAIEGAAEFVGIDTTPIVSTTMAQLQARTAAAEAADKQAESK